MIKIRQETESLGALEAEDGFILREGITKEVHQRIHLQSEISKRSV